MVIVLDNIRSLHNVGSVFRTADAAGVNKIYICGVTPEPLDRFGAVRSQFSKVALGAEKSVAWEKTETTLHCIQQLKKEGYKMWAIEQSPKAVPYYRLRAKVKTKIALILGNEVDGVSQLVLKQADSILEIPMHGKKESLNVAVAAGIVLFGLHY